MVIVVQVVKLFFGIDDIGVDDGGVVFVVVVVVVVVVVDDGDFNVDSDGIAGIYVGDGGFDHVCIDDGCVDVMELVVMVMMLGTVVIILMVFVLL